MTPRVRDYIAQEAGARGLAADDVADTVRGSRAVVEARKAVMLRLRADGFTLPQIGRWLKRDHSTVLYHVGRVA